VQTATETCPLCGTELSRVKFQEIQAKIREEERGRLAEQKKKFSDAEAILRHRLEEEYKKDLQAHTEAAVKKAKQEASDQLEQIATERDQTAKKLKEAEQREAAAKKQADQGKEAAVKLAKQQADEQIKKVAAERDQANKKLEEAEAREAEIRKQALEQAEKKHQKELLDQRAALEKDKDTSLLKQQSEFNREREALQKKVKTMDQQLQKKTANELGDGGEIDVFETLRDTFPNDKITRIKKGQPGADILHEVLHKGQVCGKIILDSKVRQGWQNSYVTKLRQDQVDASAEHAILTSSVFPAGKKEMCVESDVIIVHPARVVHIVHILREAMLTMHVRGLSMKERAGKMSKLYKLVTSDAYCKKFSEAGRLAQEILDLDVHEKKAHDNMWKKRGAFAIRINNVLREIETDVAAVIEGEDEPALNEVAPAAKITSVGVGVSQEATAWKEN